VSEVKPARPRAGFAVFVAAGILLSRLSGLVREKVFAHYFGNSDAAGVFKAAIRIPNFLQNMLGEGVLSASFIPVYANALARGEEEEADHHQAEAALGQVGLERQRFRRRPPTERAWLPSPRRLPAGITPQLGPLRAPALPTSHARR